jgi:16S rRNA (guanine527-N7)-methyltransferase
MLAQRLHDEGITLGTETIGRLEQFARLLHEWNGTHNLTGAKTLFAIYDNIVDSLYPLTFIDTPASLLDVGTGAGFPGLVLAIVWPNVPVVLAEPLGKRAAFLKYTAMELELKYVRVAKMRVEALEHEPFALISSRAVSDTRLLLDLTVHVSDPETQYLFYKGSRVEEEVAALTKHSNYAIVQWNKRNFLWIK